MTDALKQPEALRLADSLGMFSTAARSHAAAAELRRLHAECEVLREDAARYRKIRNIAVHGPFERQNHEYGWLEVSGQHEPGFDSAVDAAMENTK